jgi:hypothetical protein
MTARTMTVAVAIGPLLLAMVISRFIMRTIQRDTVGAMSGATFMPRTRTAGVTRLPYPCAAFTAGVQSLVDLDPSMTTAAAVHTIHDLVWFNGGSSGTITATRLKARYDARVVGVWIVARGLFASLPFYHASGSRRPYQTMDKAISKYNKTQVNDFFYVRP